MKPLRPNPIPSEIHSPEDGRKLLIEASKRKAKAIGIYGKSAMKITVTTAGAAFCVLLDMEMAGQVGRMYFEPLPGEQDNSVFGAKTILAGVLMSALVIELSSIGRDRSKLLDIIDRWGPRFALLFIFGSSALLYGAMSQSITPNVSSDWVVDTPFLSSLFAGFNKSFAQPLAEQLFVLGFAPLLIASAFALAKLGHWWFEAVQAIIEQLTQTGAINAAFARMKARRTQYRSVAVLFNTDRARTLSKRQEAFALMLFQIASKVIATLHRELRKSERSGGFGSIGSNPSELSREDLEALKKALSYKAILAAIRGEE